MLATRGWNRQYWHGWVGSGLARVCTLMSLAPFQAWNTRASGSLLCAAPAAHFNLCFVLSRVWSGFGSYMRVRCAFLMVIGISTGFYVLDTPDNRVPPSSTVKSSSPPPFAPSSRLRARCRYGDSGASVFLSSCSLRTLAAAGVRPEPSNRPNAAVSSSSSPSGSP